MTKLQKFNTALAKVFCVICIMLVPYYFIDSLITVGPLALLGILDERFWVLLFSFFVSILALFEDDPLNYLHK